MIEVSSGIRVAGAWAGYRRRILASDPDEDPALLDIQGLRIASRAGRVTLDDLTLRVLPGDRVGVVGESGAGKTTLALAALGLLRPGLRRSAGTVRLAGHDILALSERRRRRLRREHTAWLGQDPARALTPTMTVGRQVLELTDPTRRGPEQVAAAMAAVDLPCDEEFTRRLPHQLSGGQQQRLALARALAGRPQLVVLDEPTSRLDPVTRGLVVDEIDRLQRLQRFAILLISHDLELVARLADTVIVLHEGRAIESGPCRATLREPAQEYTRRLRDAVPDPRRIIEGDTARSPMPPGAPGTPTAPTAPTGTPPAPTSRSSARMAADHDRTGHEGLRTRRLAASYGTRCVLDDVDLAVTPGSVLAVIGASGSGKTTLARCLAALHSPDRGAVLFDGRALAPLAGGRSREQCATIQLIGQDPAGALHPRRRVIASVARPARLLRGMSRTAAADEAVRRLNEVGLSDDLVRRLPHELSGGQRQRVAIARALAATPRVLVCDEITSALDPTVAADLLDHLDRQRRERDLAVVFITHDLALAAEFADTVMVLDHGRVVEHGPTATVLRHPASPLTRLLVAAIPSLAAAVAARMDTPEPGPRGETSPPRLLGQGVRT